MQTDLISVKFQNFMSYGADGAVVDLQNKTPILITGANLDASSEGNTDSNGAGKTTILNAISYAFYDRVLSNLDKNSLINRYNKKDMLVEIVCKVGKKYFKIVRFRKNKVMGGDGLRILTSDTSDFSDADSYTDITPDSVANANRFISEEILNMPFDVFSRVVVYSSSHEPFLSLPSTHASRANQRDIIEEVFGLTEITQRADRLKEQSKETKDEFDKKSELNDLILKANSERASRIASLRSKVEEWEEQHTLTIQSLEDNINNTKLPDDFDEQVALHSERANLNKTLIETLTNISNNESKIRVLEETQTETKKKIEIAKHDLSLYLDKEKEYSEIDFQNELDILNMINTHEGKLIEADSMIVALNSEITSLEKDISGIKSELKELEHSKCPYCNQDYKDAILKIQEKELVLVELQTQVGSLQKNVEKVKKVKHKSTLILSELNNGKLFSSIAEVHRKLEEVKNIKKKIEDTKQNIEMLEAKLANNDCSSALTELKHSLTEMLCVKEELNKKLESIQLKIKYEDIETMKTNFSRVDSLKNRLRDLQNAQNPFTSLLLTEEQTEEQPDHNDRLNELNKILNHQKFLLKVLTKKDSFIRKAILKKSLPLLNERLQIYLEKIKLPHRVEFKEDMSVKIMMFDTELEFEQLSSGQKARINLALSFAFRDVLQFRTGKFSFCMLDECLDTGLSNVGIQHAVKMIKEIAKEQNLNMMIISHRDEVQSMFNKTMHVELENGFSKIKAA